MMLQGTRRNVRSLWAAPGVVMRDLRFAVRTLRRTPAFTLTAVVTLGLGIGAATAVFSIADGVLFRPLPYHEPERLVSAGADVRSRGLSNWAVQPDEFQAWRTASHTVAGLVGYTYPADLTVATDESFANVSATRVTENFLATLGVGPAIGRGFRESDFAPGATRVVLLTDGVWRRLFAADPDAAGRSVTLSGEPATIVGVLPRSFVFPGPTRVATEVLVPFIGTGELFGPLMMFGRLAPGATIDAARTELDAIAAGRGGPSGIRDTPIDGATVEPLGEALASGARTVMLLLVTAVSSLVLIACANVSNMLLARGADRSGELAVRAALGADRSALVRLTLTESAILAAGGGATGSLLSLWAVSLVAPLLPADLTLLKTVTVDLRALGFATLASMLAVVLCGLGPAWQAARADVTAALQHSSARTVAGRVTLRQVLMGFEVALAIVLLIGGGLMTNAMLRLLRIDHGYDARPVLTMRVELPHTPGSRQPSTEFVARVLSAARRTPGVMAVGASEGTLLQQTLYAGSYVVDGFDNAWMQRDSEMAGGLRGTQVKWVSTGYFEALGAPVIRGRAFAERDATSSFRVAVIGERLARKFPPGLDPVGHFLVSSRDPSDRRQIVGVVGDLRDMSLDSAPAQAIYLPIEERGAVGLTVILRSVSGAHTVGPAVERTIRQAGPAVVTNVRTLDDLLVQSVSRERLTAWLFGAFAVFGLALAAIGIGGTIAYSVARRTREIGLRLALGSTAGRVRRLLVGQMLLPVGIGLLIGLTASIFLSRFVASFLYEVHPRDTITYVAACGLLAVVAAVAAYVPARRASTINPIAALRLE